MTSIFGSLLILQLPGNQLLGPIFMYGAIFAIFYFILIRPGQQQRKKQDAELREVKRGDEIVTSGGIVGEVIQIKTSTAADGATANTMEDRITIKSGESRLVVERGRIARIVRAAASSSAAQG
jgi:preprotein translocase subunit YajC